MKQVPSDIRANLKHGFIDGTMTVDDIRNDVEKHTGKRPSTTTVYNFLKRGA